LRTISFASSQEPDRRKISATALINSGLRDAEVKEKEYEPFPNLEAGRKGALELGDRFGK